jgi:hypothetical protein
MTAALDDTALAVLRGIGGWPIADLLLNGKPAAAHLRESFLGGTHLRGFPDGTGFQCEKRGIRVTSYDVPADAFDSDGLVTAEGHQRIVKVEVALVWYSDVIAHAARVPSDVLDQLRAARTEQQAVARAEFDRSHGRIRRASRPPTPPQRWTMNRLRHRSRAADAALDAALGLALTPAEKPEQLDLFASVA